MHCYVPWKIWKATSSCFPYTVFSDSLNYCACEKNWGDSQSMLGSWALIERFWWLSNAMCFFKGRETREWSVWAASKSAVMSKCQWRFVENQDIMVYRASFLYVNQVSTVFISSISCHFISQIVISKWSCTIWIHLVLWYLDWICCMASPFSIGLTDLESSWRSASEVAAVLQNGEHRWHGCNFGMEAEHWWDFNGCDTVTLAILRRQPSFDCHSTVWNWTRPRQKDQNRLLAGYIVVLKRMVPDKNVQAPCGWLFYHTPLRLEMAWTDEQRRRQKPVKFHERFTELAGFSLCHGTLASDVPVAAAGSSPWGAIAQRGLCVPESKGGSFG